RRHHRHDQRTVDRARVYDGAHDLQRHGESRVCQRDCGLRPDPDHHRGLPVSRGPRHMRTRAIAAAPRLSRRGTAEDGYAMAALLVAMSVLAVFMTVALPVWNTQAQREKEAELVFRGEQYARAVMLYQRKFANALPPSVDVLLNDRY